MMNRKLLNNILNGKVCKSTDGGYIYAYNTRAYSYIAAMSSVTGYIHVSRIARDRLDVKPVDIFQSWDHAIKYARSEEYAMEDISLSKGNAKLGHIHNFNLLPGVTCSRRAGETCHKDGCYACKAVALYPNVRDAWTRNTMAVLLGDLDNVAYQIVRDIYLSGSSVYRWHSSGDIATPAYARMIADVCRKTPACRHYTYTKQFDILRGSGLIDVSNLVVYLSEWVDKRDNKLITAPADLVAMGYPVAGIIPKNGRRVGFYADDRFNVCPGDCRKCNMCRAGKWVLFKRH